MKLLLVWRPARPSCVMARRVPAPSLGAPAAATCGQRNNRWDSAVCCRNEKVNEFLFAVCLSANKLLRMYRKKGERGFV
eukprot:8289572-Pyramimonas_sp.AAC.1